MDMHPDLAASLAAEEAAAQSLVGATIAAVSTEVSCDVSHALGTITLTMADGRVVVLAGYGRSDSSLDIQVTEP